MNDEWFQKLFTQAADDFCQVAQGDLYKLLHEFRYLSETDNCEKTQQTYSTASDFAAGDEKS